MTAPARVEEALRIAADHPAFAGHFPGHPVVPAVVLLAETLASVAAATSRPAQRWSVAHAKFLVPVGPDAALTLMHEEAGAGGRRFEIRSEGRLVSSGHLSPCASGEGP